jgi:alpha-1,6-mannosyltransferase
VKARPALFAAAAGIELLLLIAAGTHGDFTRPGHALIFVPLILLSGVAFLFAVRALGMLPPGIHSHALWALAVAFRVAMLWCAPGDDFWRYAWEARVQNAGENPYRLSPNSPELAHLRDDRWPLINHPAVAAIYPPATELTFAAITRFSSSPLAFKIVFVAADLLTLALLLRLVNPASAAWYAWNPAVVYAFAGAAHYDSLMLLALTGAVVALHRAHPSRPGWQIASVLCLSAAISLKLVPAILLPVWAFALGSRAWLLALCAAFSALLAIPFGGIATTLQPFRDFADVTRFNELVVWIFPNPWQRNWPVSTLLCVAIAVIVVRFRNDWPRAALWVMGAALILSPVLHPWYATWILPLAVWRQKPAWTVLSISALAAFLLWETTALWTAWQPTLLTRALVIIPPLLAWRFQSRTHEPAHC